MKKFKDYPSKGGCTFCAVAHGPYLVAQKECPDGTFTKKVVKVEDEAGFVFKLMKTKIKAEGGSSALLNWLEKTEAFTDFGSSFTSKVYNWIFDSMKEAKI